MDPADAGRMEAILRRQEEHIINNTSGGHITSSGGLGAKHGVDGRPPHHHVSPSSPPSAGRNEHSTTCFCSTASSPVCRPPVSSVYLTTHISCDLWVHLVLSQIQHFVFWALSSVFVVCSSMDYLHVRVSLNLLISVYLFPSVSYSTLILPLRSFATYLRMLISEWIFNGWLQTITWSLFSF